MFLLWLRQLPWCGDQIPASVPPPAKGRSSPINTPVSPPSFLILLSFVWLYIFFRRRPWYPTPVLLPGKSHGRRSLVGCSPWGCEESDTTEWLHFHFSLSCIGEGNGNLLQCSCLENPREGGAWWAAVYGVAQSWTWLKRLSSSSTYSFPLVRYSCLLSLVFCIHFCVWRCISYVFIETDVLHVHLLLCHLVLDLGFWNAEF